MDSSRKCRKCEEIIPNWIKVDGKSRNLKNRKFCLECSPFGHHNTSSYDPIKRVKSKVYSLCSEEYKETVKLSLYKRALKRKYSLIEDKGGGCDVCGYNKYYGSLQFHHLEPKNKRFGLTLNNLWSKTWEEITEEADKCQLVCANCHGEIESKKANIVERVNRKYGTTF